MSIGGGSITGPGYGLDKHWVGRSGTDGSFYANAKVVTDSSLVGWPATLGDAARANLAGATVEK